MTSLGRIIKFGFLNFWRTPWLSSATTFTFALTLFMISVFFFMNIVAQTTIGAIEDKMDLTVSFKDETTDTQIFNLKAQLEALNGIKSVQYVSKEEAYEVWKTLPITQKIKNLVTPDRNVLPRSLQIKVQKPEDLNAISEYLAMQKWQPLIREGGISYQKNKLIIERLTNMTKFVKQVGLALVIIFLAVSVLVMFNTIRLNIISRKDEIEIQRLVGATNGFIQGPFIIEGILYGFLATLLSTFFIFLLIRFTTPLVAKYLGDVSFNPHQFFIDNLLSIFGLQFLIGFFIGSICSLISVKKYLKV